MFHVKHRRRTIEWKPVCRDSRKENLRRTSFNGRQQLRQALGIKVCRGFINHQRHRSAYFPRYQGTLRQNDGSAQQFLLSLGRAPPGPL